MATTGRAPAKFSVTPSVDGSVEIDLGKGLKVRARCERRGTRPLVQVVQDAAIMEADRVDLHSADGREAFRSRLPRAMRSRISNRVLLALGQALSCPVFANDPSPSDLLYRETDDGLFLLRPHATGMVEEKIANFTARIVQETIEDDGVEQRRAWEIEARVGSRCRQVRVPAVGYSRMAWVADLGAGAVIAAGRHAEDHVRAAVQVLSGPPPEHRVLTHTRWHQREGNAVFLHAGGAIGPSAATTGLTANLSPELARFQLPDPLEGQNLEAALRRHLCLFDLGPDRISIPLFAAPFRAVFGDVDFVIHLAGETGTLKTAIAALAQQHFGACLDARHLPGSWSSTPNFNEGLLFTLKDMLVVIDDFNPTGNVYDVQRAHRDADRLIRNVGNHAGRGRMRADATLRSTRFPRALMLSTGEDTPLVPSCQARMLVLDVSPKDIRLDALTECQQDAASGLYAGILAAFLLWVSRQHDLLCAEKADRVTFLHQRFHGVGGHLRTAWTLAELLYGLDLYFQFAQQVGAMTGDEAGELLNHRAPRALMAAATAHHASQAAESPADRFLDLLCAAIVSGRAYCKVQGTDWDETSWGWRRPRPSEPAPQGECVGWVQGDDLFLNPDAAYAVVQDLAKRAGQAITVTRQTLWKRLDAAKKLASRETDRQRYTIRKTLENVRQEVLHLRVGDLPSVPQRRAVDPPPQSPQPPEDIENIDQLLRADAYGTTTPGTPVQ